MPADATPGLRSTSLGDHTVGEIEILTEPTQIEAVAQDRKRRAAALGLGDGAADLGVVCEDEYIRVVRDPVVFPDGHTGTYIRIIEGSEVELSAGAAVLPVANGGIYLRRMFRHALRSWELEIPRGFRNRGDSLETTAITEVAEELGLPVRELIRLGEVAPNSGLLSSTVALYGAIVDERIPTPKPESSEALGAIVRLSRAQLRLAIQRGEIRDAFTLSAIQLAHAREWYVL